MWTGYDFDSLLQQTGYSIITLARFTGGKNNNRIITSRNNDFYFGFNQEGIGVWRAGGNISFFGNSLDNEWHMHLGTISDSSGDPQASLWLDGELKVFESRESDNQAFGPGQLQLGGVGNQNSACEVAEILIYSGELNAMERSLLEGYIAHKWNLRKKSSRTHTPTLPWIRLVLPSTNLHPKVSGETLLKLRFTGAMKGWKLNPQPLMKTMTASGITVFHFQRPASIGQLEVFLTENLEEGKSYYYRAHARNIAERSLGKSDSVLPDYRY